MTDKSGAQMLFNNFLFKNWEWEDFSSPEYDFINLLCVVRIYNQSIEIPRSLNDKCPIVVHCSDGLQKSAAFCALDIAVSKFLQEGKVNLFSIVSNLRKNRYECLCDVNDYGLCYVVIY